MLTYDVGHVAISLAGHDKEARYLIVGIKEDILYLADGDKRTLAKTKKKNKKHIQIAYVESEKQIKIKQAIALGTIKDEEVKHFLKAFGGKNV